MRTTVIGVALLFLGLTAAPACSQSVTVDEVLTQVVVGNDLPGGVAVVRDRDGLTHAAAGNSDVDTRAGFTPETHIRAASITKTFVAATILQLVAEGKVDLDAPIEKYLPGRIRGQGIDANAITVRELLRHQSGLPEYFDPDTPVPAEPVTADQLLDAALTRPAQFAPGSALKYTNTNYVIAGLIIEKLTGHPAADEITKRIIVPLGLSDTYFPATAQLREMMNTVDWTDAGPGFHYGLGLTSIDLDCGVKVWGHGGDIDGYHSLMAKALAGPAVSITPSPNPHRRPTRSPTIHEPRC